MKVAEFKECIKRFRDPRLSELKASRSILHRTPVEYLLYGITHDGYTNYDGNFYLWAFVVPMFLPREHLILDYGRRYFFEDKLEERLERRIANLESTVLLECLPFWEWAPDLVSFIDAVEDGTLGWAKNEVLDLQTIASARILLGEYEASVESLDELINFLNPLIGTDRWTSGDEQKLARAKHLQQLLRNNPEDAVQQLNEWTAFTKRNLRILES